MWTVSWIDIDSQEKEEWRMPFTQALATGKLGIAETSEILGPWALTGTAKVKKE